MPSIKTTIQASIHLTTTDDPRIIINGYDPEHGEERSVSFTNSESGKSQAKTYLRRIANCYSQRQIDNAENFIDTFDEEPKNNEVA